MALMVDGALIEETRERVLAWFAEAGRDLPWRATRDPYRVLVAEVLAQQTQAERAAAAWPRFLERFPDAAALAAASAPAPRTGASPGTASSSRGPQSGQAIGWAWKRRSAGSVYSARQARHIGKPAMVVAVRSYGSPVMMVNRGPQLVHVMKGCRYRRSAAS